MLSDAPLQAPRLVFVPHLWALILWAIGMVLFPVSIATGLLGLVIVFPILGHAT